MEITFKAQLTTFLNEAGSSVLTELFQSDFASSYKYNVDEVGDFSEVLQKAGVTEDHQANHGGEGEGEEYWSVYKFTKGTEELFVKFDGSYQSYSGSTFDSWFFVKPKEVTVTRYFKVK